MEVFNMKKLFLLAAILGLTAQVQAAFVKHFMQKLPVKTLAAGALTGYAIRSYQHADQTTKNAYQKNFEKGLLIATMTPTCAAIAAQSIFAGIGIAGPLKRPKAGLAMIGLGCIATPLATFAFYKKIANDMDYYYNH